MPAGVGYPDFSGGGRAMLPIDYLRMVQTGRALPTADGGAAAAGSLAEALTRAVPPDRRRRVTPEIGTQTGPPMRRAVPEIGVQTPLDGLRRISSASQNPYLSDRLSPGAGAGWADAGGSIPLPGGGVITMPEGGLTQAELDVLSGIRAGTEMAPGNESIAEDLQRRGVIVPGRRDGGMVASTGVNPKGPLPLSGVTPADYSDYMSRLRGATGRPGMGVSADVPPSIYGGSSTGGNDLTGAFFSALSGTPAADGGMAATTAAPAVEQPPGATRRVAAPVGRATSGTGTGQTVSAPPQRGGAAPPPMRAPRMPAAPRPAGGTVQGPRPVYRTPPPDAGATKSAGSAPYRNELNRKRALAGRGFSAQQAPARNAGRTETLMGNR